MDARGITKSLGGKWAGRYGLARCPVHNDRTPSLKVSDDPRKDDLIDVCCFGGCNWRDVKAALVRQGLLPEFKPTSFSTSFFTTPPLPAPDRANEAERVDLALKIWDAAGPLKNSLGWRYFTERRGLHVGLLELDHCIRFHVGFSAVVALMTDPITNEPTGVHRTFLNADATKNTDQGQKGKKMLGRQGVIRLSPDETVTYGLGICEGIEDGLAVLLSGWSPLWAATSAGAIKNFPVLLGVGALTIFRDDDTAGSDAAETCAQRWHDAGREVFLASLGEQLQ
jgi:putative DNA primase/helicase